MSGAEESDPSGRTNEGYEAERSADAAAAELPEEIREAVPEWDDEYLDRVSDRLMYNYDLERDRHVHGERWEMYGEMRVLNQKQFFHPALSYADHETEEYLFVRREPRPTVAELRRLVDLGHEIADERIVADEEHFGTDVTFVLVCEELPDDVAGFVPGFRERELLKFGYYGHYDVNLVVVVPEAERAVASEAADVAEAFTLWKDVTEPEEGFLSRFAKRFWR
ncbi:hypothetical protein [Natronomonas aquatica]|jgi:hypothetical protein|uniref:hypothetical protein n=1 Tax=Natronomonas aquatica TaxID=2841590 RepID=UPI00210BCC59|nr:hypothetical protein [Natronomonas aquatica]